jgi:hypothetical protein
LRSSTGNGCTTTQPDRQRWTLTCVTSLWTELVASSRRRHSGPQVQMGKRKSADGEGKATAPGEEPEAGSTASRRREERKAFKKAKRAAGKAAARAERQAAAGGGGGAGLKGGKRKKGGAAEGQDESERREREALALALETGEVELCVEGPGAVEGKVVGDALVLIDKSTGRVFSSQQRGPADEFVCVGTWDSSSSSITPLSRQQRPPASQVGE